MAQIEDTRLPGSVPEALVDDPKFLRDIIQMALQRFLDRRSTPHRYSHGWFAPSGTAFLVAYI